jgi:hypothetical protein
MYLTARVCARQTSNIYATSHRCIERVSPASHRLAVGSSLSQANLYKSSIFPLLFRSFADRATWYLPAELHLRFERHKSNKFSGFSCRIMYGTQYESLI